MQREPDAVPEHLEFLATDASDPRRAFVSALCDALGDRGSIVVYHQQFESQRLVELASWLPEFAGRIEKIQRRLWDLLPVIRDHVYHPAFAGSFSLKAVLPALIREMTYEGMTVADGKGAGFAWESLVRGSLGKTEAGGIWSSREIGDLEPHPAVRWWSGRSLDRPGFSSAVVAAAF